MYHYIQGTVALLEPNLAVIDAGGVGYAIASSTSSIQSLTHGEKGRLYTYLYVREDALELFGFATREELKCFLMLLGISGVGPKAALSLLSVTTPERLAMSVLSGDEKALTSAGGIGRKLAQRIILELKDKMGKGLSSFQPGAAAPVAAGQSTEAFAALSVLGYSQSEIGMALRGLDIESMSVEDLIRAALKRMSQ